MSYYLLGIRKENAKNSKFFKGYAFIHGGGKDDVNFKKLYWFDVDCDAIANFKIFAEFYKFAMEMFKKQDPEAKFMLFNPSPLVYFKTFQDVVCHNSPDLVRFLCHKYSCREFFKNDVDTLPQTKLLKYYIDYKHLKPMFDGKFERFVAQAPFGLNGQRTIIVTKENSVRAKYHLKPRVYYSVTGYIENSISVKNTFVMSEKNYMILEGYQQINKPVFRIENKGYDFESYQKLSDTAKQNIFEATTKIVQKLKRYGYLGVGEVEFVLDGDKPLFVEINPRFPNATSALNKKLTEKGFPCLFELNLLSFEEQEKFDEICEKFKTI